MIFLNTYGMSITQGIREKHLNMELNHKNNFPNMRKVDRIISEINYSRKLFTVCNHSK